MSQHLLSAPASQVFASKGANKAQTTQSSEMGAPPLPPLRTPPLWRVPRSVLLRQAIVGRVSASGWGGLLTNFGEAMVLDGFPKLAGEEGGAHTHTPPELW